MKHGRAYWYAKALTYPTKGTAAVTTRLATKTNGGYSLRFVASANYNATTQSSAGHFEEATWVFPVIEDDKTYNLAGVEILVKITAALLSGPPLWGNHSYAGLTLKLKGSKTNFSPRFEYELDRRSNDGDPPRFTVNTKHTILPILPRPNPFLPRPNPLKVRLDLIANVVTGTVPTSWAKIDAKVQVDFKPFIHVNRPW